jgi:hypothetical protein
MADVDVSGIYDEVSLAEAVTTRLEVLISGVYDEGTVTESVTAAVSSSSPSVVDSTTVAENVNTALAHTSSKYDSIVITEDVVIDLVGAGTGVTAVECVKKYVEETVYGANFYTNAIIPMPTKQSAGYLNISVYGTFTGTVTLQRSFNGGTNWYDVSTYTSSDEASLTDLEVGVMYRIGVKTGGWTTGSAYIRLGVSK